MTTTIYFDPTRINSHCFDHVRLIGSDGEKIEVLVNSPLAGYDEAPGRVITHALMSAGKTYVDMNKGVEVSGTPSEIKAVAIEVAQAEFPDGNFYFNLGQKRREMEKLKKMRAVLGLVYDHTQEQHWVCQDDAPIDWDRL